MKGWTAEDIKRLNIVGSQKQEEERKQVATTEHAEQVSLFSWAESVLDEWPELDLLYAIPNQDQGSLAYRSQMVAEGLKRGVPDVCLPVARGGYFGLYVEMKKPKTRTSKAGRVRSEQKHWLGRLREAGYFTTVCYGFDDVKQTITAYLQLPPTARIPLPAPTP